MSAVGKIDLQEIGGFVGNFVAFAIKQPEGAVRDFRQVDLAAAGVFVGLNVNPEDAIAVAHVEAGHGPRAFLGAVDDKPRFLHRRFGDGDGAIVEIFGDRVRAQRAIGRVAFPTLLPQQQIIPVEFRTLAIRANLGRGCFPSFAQGALDVFLRIHDAGGADIEGEDQLRPIGLPLVGQVFRQIAQKMFGVRIDRHVRNSGQAGHI